ncbi:hypothetical protein ACFFHM_08540 [Halalkalibacter kiskunsagensis]|uniref:Group-specific protein n=1 Tax=Halalkalibacter kiskunsagensis TaxID=1548599 RepID=A0ABV6KBW8_9BACI
MSSCKLDHPVTDVVSKLESQKSFLPADIFSHCQQFIESSPTQLELNELFHLLKKYDLASAGEQIIRNKKLNELVSE